MAISDLPAFIREHYEIHEWRHASAVLARDFPEEWQDIIDVLMPFRVKKIAITVGGGNKSAVAEGIDKAFQARGWVEKQFVTEIVVDGVGIRSPTHQLYSIIEQCSPGPYLELFARHTRPGWVSWGNEVDGDEEAREPKLLVVAACAEHRAGEAQLPLCETPSTLERSQEC